MISAAIKQAQAMHRKAIESTYTGKCQIYEQRNVIDPVTKITKPSEVMVKKDVSCQLSHESVSAVSEDSGAFKKAQGIKLFLAPELTVKPGSKIVVTQDGVTGTYGQSGIPAHFATHQEVSLNEWGGYA